MTGSTIYDHPHYYDVLFGFDRSHEAAFYGERLRRGGLDAGARVLEIGCGPARVGRLLARAGYRVTGLDRSPEMLAYARDAAAAEGLAIDTLHADMSDFACEARFDAAVNPMSSFRLLHGDADVDAHLRCMAAAVRPGGLYLIDLTLQTRPDEPETTTDEPWELSRGDVTVRADDAGIAVRDGDGELMLAWGKEGHLRGTTAEEFLAHVGRSPGWRAVTWHPETGRATGVSEFDATGQPEPPNVGRTMVALLRTARSGESDAVR